MKKGKIFAKNLLLDIRIVVSDIDGVLTRGFVTLDVNGNEYQSFHVHDGCAIKLLQSSGLLIALISGRNSPIAKLWAERIGINDVYIGVENKLNAYYHIKEKYNLTDENICYIGDDIKDIPVMKLVAFPVAVANARDEVKKVAKYVSKTPAGYGVLREVTELILKAQKKWDKALLNDLC